MTDTNAPAPGPLPDVPPGPKKVEKSANREAPQSGAETQPGEDGAPEASEGDDD